jgi:ubiquinone/menaquinone biosynthesis C-methylase UbiE
MGLFGWLFRHKKRRTSRPLTWERTPSHPPQVYADTEGRRHRGDAPYLLPKDGQELQRLDYQHFILRQVLNGNTFAPVHGLLRKGGRVLDVGCGTGRWCHEIAASYPKTQVCGFDLEDVPRTSPTPPNYQFYGGNLLNGLPFTAHSFQYVHQRLLVAAIPLEKWPVVMGELRRVTTPGGWIELVEMGNTFHQVGPATQQFLTWWVKIAASKGIDASKMAQIGALLKQAGLYNIKAETKTLAVGSWGGRLGNLLAQDMLAGWPTMRPLAQSMLGVSPEMFNAVLSSLTDEWNTYHTTYEVYFACGQV